MGDRGLEGYRNSPYYDELRSVFERLTTLLPDKVTVSSEDLIAHISVISDPVTRIDEDVWSVVREGLYKQQSIAIHYQSPGHTETAARIVDPLHLVGHRGEWYLLCWSHHHEEVRIYALFRIKQARVRRETFTRPEGFSVEKYIDPSFGVFVNEEAADIAVRFDGEAASKIPERRWSSGRGPASGLLERRGGTNSYRKYPLPATLHVAGHPAVWRNDDENLEQQTVSGRDAGTQKTRTPTGRFRRVAEGDARVPHRYCGVPGTRRTDRRGKPGILSVAGPA